MARWCDVNARTKEHSLQMVLLWQSRHNHDPEHMTVGTNGEITMKSKQELKTLFQGEIATLKPQIMMNNGCSRIA